MNGHGESDKPIVPAKAAKAGESTGNMPQGMSFRDLFKLGKRLEGRGLAKENGEGQAGGVQAAGPDLPLAGPAKQVERTQSRQGARGAYRAKPVKRAFVPKADGKQRPIGVPALEDKIVQRATVRVLNAVYEADFPGFSYGFRPGRSAHLALDALAVARRDEEGELRARRGHPRVLRHAGPRVADAVRRALSSRTSASCVTSGNG